MKTVFVLICLVVAVLATELIPEEKKYLKDIHDFCQANPKTYEDENKLKNLSQYIDDYQVGVHMSCMAIKAKLQFPSGELNIDTMRAKVGMLVDRSEVFDIIQKCGKEAETPGKTANLMWNCFVQSGVEYIHKF